MEPINSYTTDPASLFWQPGGSGSIQTRTTSSSSPDTPYDAAYDAFASPVSLASRSPELIKPKTEEFDDDVYSKSEDEKPVVDDQSKPKKRGRPRKHPTPEQPKESHSRSKTGCGTCRKRKKKCDETKPVCTNCRKNNVICDGYERTQPWRSLKEKLSLTQSPIPTELPRLVDGVEGKIDQFFLQYFIRQVSNILSLTDQQNIFHEIIVPMAMSHLGLMHSLLYLSASYLLANSEPPNYEWQERSEYHGSKALQLLRQDLASFALDEQEGRDTRVSDSLVAQSLVLCLQTVCAGDVTGSYRLHINAMKEMLAKHKQDIPNEKLRQFVLEFLVYFDYSNAIISLRNPLDHRSMELMEVFQTPESMIQPQAGTLIGVLDGLFVFVPRIRYLRDRIRVSGWEGEGILEAAFAIDAGIRGWQCKHTERSPRRHASLLYRQCIWIYLYRTIPMLRPTASFQEAVDQGISCLNQLQELVTGDDGSRVESVGSVLLLPLFLLGCAAFRDEQRLKIRAAFQQLKDWRRFGNIQYAHIIVEEVWRKMDHGGEGEAWGWEDIIANRGWDFLMI